MVTVIWCAQRRSISTLGAYHRGSVGSRNFNEERFGNSIVAYFAGHLGRGKGLWVLRKNLVCVVGLRFVWFVYSPSPKHQRLPKNVMDSCSFHIISMNMCFFLFILSSPHLSLHQFQFICSTAGARPALLHRMLGRRLQSRPEDQAHHGHHDCHAGARNGGGESDGSHGGTSCALDWWLARFVLGGTGECTGCIYHIGILIRWKHIHGRSLNKWYIHKS